MGTLLYVLKMVIVGPGKLKLRISQKHGLFNLTFFIVYLYSYYWFSIPVAADAPHLTLMLWKDFKRWTVRDHDLSSVCLKKLDMHTWYLSPRNITLALFSKQVDDVKMCYNQCFENSQSQVDFRNPKKLQIYEESTLYSFVNNEYWLFFELLGIEPTIFSLPTVYANGKAAIHTVNSPIYFPYLKW